VAEGPKNHADEKKDVTVSTRSQVLVDLQVPPNSGAFCLQSLMESIKSVELVTANVTPANSIIGDDRPGRRLPGLPAVRKPLARIPLIGHYPTPDWLSFTLTIPPVDRPIRENRNPTFNRPRTQLPPMWKCVTCSFEIWRVPGALSG
jgi:hypothetical protein